MDYIVCSNCEQENFTTAHFCTHCGFWLEDAVDQTLLKTISMELQFEIGKHIAHQNPPPKLSPDEIAFYVIETKALITFTYSKPIILGRGSKSRTPANDLVDLSNHNAYALGLSRNHAQIRRIERNYYISDLATPNGTTLNEKLLVPNESYRLEDKDVLLLGRLGLIFYHG